MTGVQTCALPILNDVEVQYDKCLEKHICPSQRGVSAAEGGEARGEAASANHFHQEGSRGGTTGPGSPHAPSRLTSITHTSAGLEPPMTRQQEVLAIKYVALHVPNYTQREVKEGGGQGDRTRNTDQKREGERNREEIEKEDRKSKRLNSSH